MRRHTLRRLALLFLVAEGAVSSLVPNLSHAAQSVTAPAKRSETANRPNIVVLMADDWGWPHAGVYGDTVVKTPTFDRLAREGVLFTRAFCPAPSCSPSRAGLLTGQWIHRLEEGGNLNGFLPNRFPVYPDLLEAAGYFVGKEQKGWGPGRDEPGGWTRNPAGPDFKDFASFMKARPKDRPFCYWFGSHDPHRGYDAGSGVRSGMRLDRVTVPPYLPDTPEVRSDICDYYFEVERFDRDSGNILRQLEEAGELDNTIVVMTGDHGWPFPHGKTNLYDSGMRVPLVISWPARLKGGRISDAFVNFIDLAPTFLKAAGVKPPDQMSGESLLPLLTGNPPESWRDAMLVERERHADVREGHLSYPARGIRTKDFLFIRNYRPDRWPEGDPEPFLQVGRFGDVDGAYAGNVESKAVILVNRLKPAFAPFFQLNFAKRPAEELYDLTKDPDELHNVAADPDYASQRETLRTRLETWLHGTGDLRVLHDDNRWDEFPYYYPDRPSGRYRTKAELHSAPFDFRARVTFFAEKTTPYPESDEPITQGFRPDLAHPDAPDRLVMAWPCFLDDQGSQLSDGSRIPRNSLADFWFITPDIRARMHRLGVKRGTRFIVSDGVRAIGEAEVIQVFPSFDPNN